MEISPELWVLIRDAELAAVVSMLATGLGPLPLLWDGVSLRRYLGEAYALAGGLMVAASFFNLVAPGIERAHVLEVAAGVLAGCFAFWWADLLLKRFDFNVWELSDASSRRIVLIIGAMFIHSLPEGIAIGVGYGSGEPGFGLYLAVAISIHNIPEGLAIGVPMRSEGLGIGRACFWAVFSSLPQPLGALPALLAVWLFQPLLPYLLGFAAGAMIFLVLSELLAESLDHTDPTRMSWSFMTGFLLMMVLQYVI